MIIIPILHGLNLSHSYGRRGKGRHMSELYGSLYADLEPKRYGKKATTNDAPRERWGIGMAFEEMLEAGLSARVFNENPAEQIMRPGEFETLHTEDCSKPKERRTYGCGCVCGGGVLFTPDLIIDNGHTRVGEIKLNSMSAKGAPHKLGETYSGLDSKFDKYICQLQAYCLHVGTPFARLYMFSMREMVNFNEPGIFRSWDIEFTPHELRENWEWLRVHGVQKGLLI